MISPELLRRYPFFGFMSDHCFKTIAMHAEEEKFKNGDVILEEGQEATALYFLMEGGVALLYDRGGTKDQGNKELHVGDINAGEPFGISALIEPHLLTATVKATQDSRAIRIEASAIQELCMDNPEFAFKLMKKIASAAIERLNATRIQLAAAYA